LGPCPPLFGNALEQGVGPVPQAAGRLWHSGRFFRTQVPIQFARNGGGLVADEAATDSPRR